MAKFDRRIFSVIQDVRKKKPILFGLSGDPLSITEGDEELNAATVEEALERAKAAQNTRYLKALENESTFVVLVDTEKAQEALFKVETAEDAEECMRSGARPTGCDWKDWTPLHSASLRGRVEVMELLLALSHAIVNVNARDARDETPLHYASRHYRAEAAEVLLAPSHAIANVNAHDDNGLTPLHLATERNNERLVEVLLAAGADVNARTIIGWTPLHFAYICTQSGVAEVLLAHGAEVDARDAEGRTPLHNASGYHNERVVEQLLAHGAEVNARDAAGKTPLYRAVNGNYRQGHLRVMEVLQAAGAVE